MYYWRGGVVVLETWRIMESSFGNDVARSLAYSDTFGDVISTARSCFVNVRVQIIPPCKDCIVLYVPIT